MSHDSQQAIIHVLQQDSVVLASLMEKLKHLKELQSILTQHLEPKLAAHCEVAVLEKVCLTVVTHSALWATRFRFQIPVLLERLQTHPEFKMVKKIVCKIRPAANNELPPAAPVKPPLSAATSSVILTAAKTIKHERLQDILQKIAKNKRTSP